MILGLKFGGKEKEKISIKGVSHFTGLLNLVKVFNRQNILILLTLQLQVVMLSIFSVSSKNRDYLP